MKRSEIPYFIATLLINELSDGNRNVAECEKILKETLDILKSVTLDSSRLQ